MKPIIMDLFMLAFSLAVALTPTPSTIMFWVGWAGVAAWGIWLIIDSIILFIRSKRRAASAPTVIPEP